jgi:hypothetical protein
MLVFGSHLGPLAMAVCVTKGPVLELGMGLVSTPALHELCRPERMLVSVDQDPGWFVALKDFASPTHLIRHAPDLEKFFAIENGEWGVVFVDNGHIGCETYKTRIRAVELLLPRAEIIVLHDTEDYVRYAKLDLSSCFSVWTFKPPGLPWTTLASQTVDIKKALMLT